MRHLLLAATMVFIIGGASRVAEAQGVAGVLAGGSAIVGSACPESGPTAGDSALPSGGALPRRERPRRDSTASVAIVLLAEASAREIRFARQPRISIRLCGSVDSVRVLERRNLPQPVVVGETYRDVYVAVEILGRLDAACITARLTGADSVPGGRACAAISVDGASASPGTSPP